MRRAQERPVTTMPAMSGSTARPLRVAVTSCMTCRYSGINATMPRMARLSAKATSATILTYICRSRERLAGAPDLRLLLPGAGPLAVAEVTELDGAFHRVAGD